MEYFFKFNMGSFAAMVLPMLTGMAAAKRIDAAAIPQVGIDTPNVISAMTFNIRVDTIIDGFHRWDNRKQNVCNLISDHAPDVIGLQEAEAHQYRDVRSQLPMYSGYAVGRNDGRGDGETCPILYRTDRFVKTDFGTFWFSDTPDVPGSKDWGNLPPRICSWVRLINKKTLAAFYVYNLHLDQLSQNSRSKSVRLLTQRIAARPSDDPFIVMGDFNMRLSNSAMEYLCSNTLVPMKDAWQSVNPNSSVGTIHRFRGSVSSRMIDHIPLSKGLRALSVTVDSRKYNGRFPSDHSPVIARILMPSRTFAEGPVQTVPSTRSFAEAPSAQTATRAREVF
ncbi:MAG: endonuclease/exonuclease/phosphatase family protein [Planctomycetaceae bacterium]|nr:endonuclease/exonuclease/phosphatase family protein [Planctomycetaceae bacterium]